MIRIPYGISNFEKLVSNNYHYVDRTTYLELLEKSGESYVFLVRPRRFGKSLFISTLQYYYGLEHKAKFKELFGNYYIGQHPTPRANTYLVLKLSFTAIHTETPELTRKGFLGNVQHGVLSLMYAHQELFSAINWKAVESTTTPSDAINVLYKAIKKEKIKHKLYIVIDEYDHFANELLAFDFSNFKNIVSKNGYVRKFYETLKEGTLDGTVDKIFITGVTPITLDSLTSGFNIAAKLTTDIRLNQMYGFTQAEVVDILHKIGIPESEIADTLKELTFWYNGYLFNEESSNRIYNPDMILYFAQQYLAEGKFPKNLLDTNIASDYRKVRNLFKLDNKEAENITLIKQLLTEGSASGELTREYSFEKTWTNDDLLSLLFYQGILTISGGQFSRLNFEIPNAVIKKLYFQYFQQLTLMEANIQERNLNIWDKIEQLAVHNKPQPLMDLVQDIIAKLATQDRAHFNELTFKAIFTSLFYTANIYKIYSEPEVRKSKTEKGRVDLLLLQRPPYEIPFQFIFELKYLAKKEIGRWEKTKTVAIQQLKQYLKYEDSLQQVSNLKAYVLIFSAEKSEAVVVEAKRLGNNR